MLGIYVHIPFCEKKCNYCAFSSFSKLNEKEKYISYLTREIESFAKKNNEKVDTIYIGGGTPSVLSTEEISKILETIKLNYEIAGDAEITIECNPNSITEEKLVFYKKSGVNRISIGVQRLNDDKLKILGRLHTSEQAIKSIRLAKKYFNNVSVDFIIGLNGQEEEYEEEMQKLICENVNHISVYMLQIEDETPLKNMVEENPDIILEDDEYVKIYEKIVKKLKNNGYFQYEVSNFAQKGFESKHNFKYWTGDNYVGFGLSAHSFINGERYANAKDFEGYYAGKIVLREKLTTEQKIEEHIMLGLRCKNGINISYLKELGYDIEKNENLIQYLDAGILTKQDKQVFLNPDYYSVNNMVIVGLMP